MMYKKLLIIIVFLVSCDSITNLELPGDDYFFKYYGNDGNQKGIDLEIDLEGNIYLLGNSDSLGGILMLLKTDSKGNLLWKKSFGKENGYMNYVHNAKDLLLTADNNKLIVLANYAPSFLTANVKSSIYVAEFNLSGDIIKTTHFNDNSVSNVGYSINEVTDGFIIAGSTTKDDQTDGLQVRLKSDLTEYDNTWRKTNGSEYTDVIVSIFQNANEFALFGYSNKKLPSSSSSNKNNYNYWVRTLNAFGEPTRNESFITDNSKDFILNSVIQTPTGYLLAGQYSDSNVSNVYISTLSKNLSPILSFSVSKSDFKTPLNYESYDAPNARVAAVTNSGFYVFSNNNSSSNYNWYLDKFNNGLTSEFLNPVNFGGEFYDAIGGIKITPYGKVLLFGTMSIGTRGAEQKMVLIKVNSSGLFAK